MMTGLKTDTCYDIGSKISAARYRQLDKLDGDP